MCSSDLEQRGGFFGEHGYEAQRDLGLRPQQHRFEFQQTGSGGWRGRRSGSRAVSARPDARGKRSGGGRARGRADQVPVVFVDGLAGVAAGFAVSEVFAGVAAEPEESVDLVSEAADFSDFAALDREDDGLSVL